MGRTRLTALVTATAVALGTVTAPSALAAPTTTVVTSAHGQLLCEVTPSAEDIQSGEALEAAYRATVQEAAKAVQAKYSQHASAFDSVNSRDVLGAPALAGAVAALTTAGYNAADITVILLGAKHPEWVVTDTRDSLLPTTRASLNRSKAQRTAAQNATGNRAPLLSTGTNFSTKFRGELRAAEGKTNLATTIAAFEQQAGYSVMATAWDNCVKALEAAGAQDAMTPLPEIEYTVPAPGHDAVSSVGGSSIDQNAAIGIGVVAVLFAIGAGYAFMMRNGNMNIGGYSAPVLSLPAVPAR